MVWVFCVLILCSCVSLLFIWCDAMCCSTFNSRIKVTLASRKRSYAMPATTRNTCYSLWLWPKCHSPIHTRSEHKQYTLSHTHIYILARFFRSYFQTIVINNTAQHPVSRASAFNRKLLTQSHLIRSELHEYGP